MINLLMYVLSTDCQWRADLKDLPPRSTINHCFCRGQHDGTWPGCIRLSTSAAANNAGCEASLTAAIIDSQSVKSTESSSLNVTV